MHGFGLIISEHGSGAYTIALRGELDLAHVYTFDEELRRVEATRPDCVVIDLRELRFVDSSGIARLLAARRRARRAGYELLVVRGSHDLQRLFELTAADEAFEMISEPPLALST